MSEFKYDIESDMFTCYFLYQLGDDSASIGGEKQAGISGGSQSPADIASGRAHIVRWTMVLRRPKRSVDLQRCAVEVCHAIA